MLKSSCINKSILILLVCLLTAAWANGAAPLPPAEDYLGSEQCKQCHEKFYKGWKNTFHSTAVQDVKKNPDAILGDFSQPGIGFTTDDIEFTIGGHWNQRYMKKIGDDHYILPKSWSISSQKWEPNNVWGWRKMPYSKFCIGCHVTRFDPADGSYVEHTIGCESCHGPGRKHAESEDPADIVNPAKLGSVEMELICASCHVRGKDPSGVYHFPVGFTPGQNLADYYIPGKMDEGESVADALLRLFRKWWANAGSADAECDVCGIYGNKTDKEPKTVTEYCMSCHEFDYPRHTNHDASVSETLECADCHKKVSIEIDEDEEEDVHSVSYFLVHKRTCYDRNFTNACRSCHQSFTADMIKARIDTWRGRESIHE